MPKKNSSWIQRSGIYGTWTFTTETMTDVGYYKGLAYVVMHLMPDPMQVKSCTINADNKQPACIEADNQACSHTGVDQRCISTETEELEWSDGVCGMRCDAVTALLLFWSFLVFSLRFFFASAKYSSLLVCSQYTQRHINSSDCIFPVWLSSSYRDCEKDGP